TNLSRDHRPTTRSSDACEKSRTAEIHVDDDEQLTVASEQGTNLVKVAVHEVGTPLGLHHTPRNSSIMYAIYSRAIPNSNFELCREDRTMAQEIYGICKVRFDTAFDWVRQRPDGHFIYNTYFFRGPRYWMYENRYNRTRYGDPLLIVPEWKGIPTNVDAFAHVWTHLHDATYFLKGSSTIGTTTSTTGRCRATLGTSPTTSVPFLEPNLQTSPVTSTPPSSTREMETFISSKEA
ncbi:hypothetical protein HPB47_028191, partial [Ixodes persulcatus]